MPIRTASLNRRLEKNGATLHRAMLIRIHSHGADEPSEAEQALIEERRLLKEEKAKRQAAEQPRAKAADKLVRTHHAMAKDKPKPKKEPKEHKDAKPGAKGAHKPTRAEKHATKAAALEAAKRAAKKSAKT